MEGDTQIGWWASAASIVDTSPSFIVSVSNPASFSVSPALSESQTGVWYHLNPAGKANGSAFTVIDPRLSLVVEDTTVGVDVTDKWVPTDDELRFRIETNMIPIAQRSGVTSVPITIVVRDPNGGTFTSLVDNAGTSNSIVNIPVTTTPFTTASIWDTGHRDIYVPGTYTIWAECNVNSMKDNYERAGKTVSQKVSLLNQDHNPLIKGSYTTETPVAADTTVAPTVSRTPVPTTLTTIPTLPPTTVITPQPPTAAVTQVPATVVPTTTKKSPGFEAAFCTLAVIGAVLLINRRDA